MTGTGMGMFDRRVVNGVAVALLSLFLIQSAVDIASINYEVPAGMYGIITIVVSAVVGTAVGVSLVDRKNGKGGENGGGQKEDLP
jgi:hypothetical protein